MSDHPLLTWIVGALVPAAIGAAAIIYVYRRQERTRRHLARPLVDVHWDLQLGRGPFTRWRNVLNNLRDDAVNIEAITVVAGEEIIEWQAPLEPPDQYWSRVLLGAGILRIQQIEGNVIKPTLSIKGNTEVLLFDAYVAGDPDSIHKALHAVEIRLRCRSAAGETSACSYRYGRVTPL